MNQTANTQKQNTTGQLEAPMALSVPVAAQPKRTEMNIADAASNAQTSRMRGGGAAKDCCIGLFGICICMECCEGICDCIADIVCCPCEMMGC